MNKTNKSKIGLVSCVALLGVLTGCIVEDGPHHHRAVGVYVAPPTVYVAPPVVQVEPAVVVEDSYVYYPGYQVYYNSYRHQYSYREGRDWVVRPAPPRVSAEVLFASPSVRLDFHDSPANHHTTIAKQYPKHWAPPGPGRGHDEHHH